MTDKRSDSTAREIRGEFWIEKDIEDKRKALGYEIQLLIATLIFSLGTAISLVANIFEMWTMFLDVNTVGKLAMSFYITLLIKIVTLLALDLVTVKILIKVIEKVSILKEGKYV